MKPYGVRRKDKFGSKCPCCSYEKYVCGKTRKKRARQQNKKECIT